MDVITFLQPENHVARPHFPVSDRKSARAAFSLSVPSFASLREMPSAASFPVLFLLLVTVALASTPLFQQRYGFYRLDRLDLGTDTAAEAAMREMVTPEPDASLLAGATAELPLSIRAISYSTYKVRNGDTISAILTRSGLRNIGSILSVNNIDNARRIRSGQALQVPSMDGLLYTVGRGDNLALIAKRYTVPINAILDANDLTASTLTAGEKLFIPGASMSVNALRRAMGQLFIYPVKGRLTSRFGYRSDPFTGARTFHTGIDLAGALGTPIKAVMDGRVATTGYSTLFGNYIIITHDAGYQTLYGHLSSIGVQRGQNVSQGALIGKMGSTGYSTGSHLHLSVYKNGKMIDPFSVLN